MSWELANVNDTHIRIREEYWKILNFCELFHAE